MKDLKDPTHGGALKIACAIALNSPNDLWIEENDKLIIVYSIL